MGWFEGFEDRRHQVGNIALRVRTGGNPAAPPLLLVHGFPQTSAMWHRVALRLAPHFRLVMPDLRGYGESDKPAGDADHANYSKRTMAQDLHGLMRSLGHEPLPRRRPRPRRARVAPAGARPSRRGAAARADRHRAHQGHVRPQRPALRQRLLPLVLPDPARAPPRAHDRCRPEHYAALEARRLGLARRRVLSRPRPWPSTCAASAGPRRSTAPARTTAPRPASTSSTTAHRAPQGLKLACDLLVLWGQRGVIQALFDPLALWRAQCAGTVSGEALPAGHFLAEELPDETADRLLAFFRP